jgi:hypothetical protein
MFRRRLQPGQVQEALRPIDRSLVSRAGAEPPGPLYEGCQRDQHMRRGG